MIDALRSGRYTRAERIVVVTASVLALIVAGCAEGAPQDDSPAGESDMAFIAAAGAATVYPGSVRDVPKLPEDLEDAYFEYSRF